MKLLTNESLEDSTVVANCRMNRERQAVGTNSYQKELGFDPIAFLADRVGSAGTAAWLDLCCGCGRALIEAAESFQHQGMADKVMLHGVDLVDMFDGVPNDADNLSFEAASLHEWTANREYDLITCVHGLHYVGDKLSLVERAIDWLSAEGQFAASLDLKNLRSADGKPLGRRVSKRFRDCGLVYNSRRHLLTCVGRKSSSLAGKYMGADDTAGPNYSGQEAVDSYYELNA